MNSSRRNFIGKGVLAALAGTVALNSKAGSAVLHHTQNESFSISPDGKNWLTITLTPDDLAQSTVNAQGQRELVMHTEVPDGDWSAIRVKSSGDVVGVFTGIGKPPNEFICMLIVVVIVIVVAGIITYQLIEVCRKYLGPDGPPKKDGE